MMVRGFCWIIRGIKACRAHWWRIFEKEWPWRKRIRIACLFIAEAKLDPELVRALKQCLITSWRIILTGGTSLNPYVVEAACRDCIYLVLKR